MKLSFIFLVLSLNVVFASHSYAQKIVLSIDLNNKTVTDVLDAIEHQSEFRFYYNSKLVDTKQKVSVNVKNADVFAVLNQLFAATNIGYKVIDKDVILVERDVNSSSPQLVVIQQGISINGTITDNTGEPMPGVNVLVKGTMTGAVSDVNGKYTITVPNRDAVLVFSFIGYASQEIPVGDRRSIEVTLAEDTQLIDEVVVVGYGTQKKVNLTGAVTSVKMTDVLGDRPVGSSVMALQSAVPGLQIEQATGKPGSGTFINLRGVTSINNSETGPLVLVDNVPMDLNMIDPNDIESISVLKDAAASAIYGARAAFGIILVTTKKASKDSPVRVNYSNNFAFSNPASLPNKIDPYSSVKVYKDLNIESYYGGQSVTSWLGFMDEYYNQGKYPDGYVVQNGIRYNLAATDAYKDLMDSHGFQQQHNLSLTGGSSKSTYRIAFGMIDSDGILYSDRDSYARYNATAFLSMDATPWLTGQMDVRYADAKTSTPQGNAEGINFWGYTNNYQPMGPLGMGTDQSTGDPTPYTSPRNLLLLEDPKMQRDNNIRVLGRIILKPVTGLEITGEYSFYRTWWSESASRKFYPTLNPVSGATIYSLGSKDTGKGLTNYYMNQGFTTNNAINAYATYKITLAADHNFSIMGGFNQEAYYYETLYGQKLGLLVQDLPSLSMADGTQTTDDSFNEYALRGVFYRFNYDYKGRYLFEANGRYDGSSRFPKDSRFGFFPSFSAGWRVTEESFFEFARDYVSNLKLRASWGQIGNQNVSYYGYLPSMSPGKLDNTNAPFNGQGTWILPGGTDYVTSMSRPGLVSSNYTWETVQSLDFGVDAAFFKNQLDITFDWYKRDTKDMLAPAKAGPIVLGASYPNENSAALQTKGWELTVQWRSTIGDDIRYNIGVNIYDSQSTITKYDNPSNLLINDGSLYLRKDMKYGEIWGYTSDRYYTADDFDGSGKLKAGVPYVRGSRPNPGDVLYKNLNGEDKDKPGENIIDNGSNTLEDPGDMTIIGNNTARFQYGINGGISWKSFDFSFFFMGVGKRDMIMPGYSAYNGQFPTSIFDFQTDYWREDRTEAYWPRIYGVVPSGVDNNSGYNTRIQTKYLRNGAFLRLKNVTLGYNLPKNICEKLYIQNFRVFVSGENLYTWHHLPKGYNPDMFVAVPGMLAMSQGIRGDAGAGNWSYPLMRQFSVGINLTF